MLAAIALCPSLAVAQASLLEDYARVAALVNYMTTYVGETLLACAAASSLTDQQAEARFAAYRERNAALLGRADAWIQDAEKRLAARGEGGKAKLRYEDAGMTAMAAASSHVQTQLGQVRDVPAFCAARISAIETGRFDVSGNAELQQLLAK